MDKEVVVVEDSPRIMGKKESPAKRAAEVPFVKRSLNRSIKDQEDISLIALNRHIEERHPTKTVLDSTGKNP